MTVNQFIRELRKAVANLDRACNTNKFCFGNFGQIRHVNSYECPICFLANSKGGSFYNRDFEKAGEFFRA